MKTGINPIAPPCYKMTCIYIYELFQVHRFCYYINVPGRMRVKKTKEKDAAGRLGYVCLLSCYVRDNRP